MDSFICKCQSTSSTSTLNRKRNAKDEEEIDYIPSKKRRCIRAPTRLLPASPTNRKRKSEQEDDDSTPAKKPCFYSSFCYQNFSLPAPLMHYILKNPSTSKLYQKLIQSCKYFFIRNPILVIEKLIFRENWCTWSEKDRKYIDLSTTTSKIWITDKIEILSDDDSLSSVSPRIYRNDAEDVDVYAEELSWNTFLFIASKAENVVLKNNVIRDGSIVPVEEIVAALSEIETIKFHSTSPNITSNTVKKLLEIPHLYNIEEFELWNIPDSFDIETLFAYIKKDEYTKFSLTFDESISQAYKNRVEAIIDEIFETENEEADEEGNYHDYKTPWMIFTGLDEAKIWKMMRYAD